MRIYQEEQGTSKANNKNNKKKGGMEKSIEQRVTLKSAVSYKFANKKEDIGDKKSMTIRK